MYDIISDGCHMALVYNETSSWYHFDVFIISKTVKHCRMGQALRGLGRLEEARKALLKATGNCKEEFKSKLIAELAHVDRLMAEEETKKVQGSQNETRDIAK